MWSTELTGVFPHERTHARTPQDFIDSSTSVLIAAKLVDNYNDNAAYYLGKVDKLPEPV